MKILAIAIAAAGLSLGFAPANASADSRFLDFNVALFSHQSVNNNPPVHYGGYPAPAVTHVEVAAPFYTGTGQPGYAPGYAPVTVVNNYTTTCNPPAVYQTTTTTCYTTTTCVVPRRPVLIGPPAITVSVGWSQPAAYAAACHTARW